MKQWIKLIFIGMAAGVFLAAFLKIIEIATGSHAYVLLVETDYIPVLKRWHDVSGTGLAFHFITCICSVVVLFYVLKSVHLEKRVLPYIFVYTIGGAILYSLTALSAHTPEWTDTASWGFWTLGHALYAVIVGFLVRYW